MQNTRTPVTLIITGKTGSGKSEYVASFVNAYVIDPLQEATPNRKHEWETPNQDAKVDMVVFDHVQALPDATPQLLAAKSWCEKREIPLWVVLQSVDDMKAFELPLNTATEMRIFKGQHNSSNFAIFFDMDGKNLFEFDQLYGEESGLASLQHTASRPVLVPPRRFLLSLS